VRFAAYETISKLPQVHSSVSLIDGISDPSEQVRIAAATAINHNLSDIVVSGLLSKIETSGRHSKRAHITHAIIDSYAGNIFSRLLGSDSFVFLATDYLSGCHERTVSYFSDILVKRGTRSLARTIRDNARVKENDMPLTIFCVDDSQICLKYYTKLFHSMGHVPFTFENPEEALTEMQKMRPHLVITDLNILGINGLQLSEQIRETWSVSELPIVIITTQKDFKPQVDHINLVLHKPVEYKMLKPLIDKIH
jgi:CheY-like chemotaxis protein